jgi:hypothetical protein
MSDQHDEPPAGTFEFHELANVLPLLSDEALGALAADIGARGLIHPIWMFEGKVLDGRNRVIACSRANVKITAPHRREFRGSYAEAVQFVVTINTLHRHLNAGQRAMLGSLLVTTKHGGVERFAQGADLRLGEYQGVTHAEAAERIGVSERSIDMAVQVRDQARPEIVEAVRCGSMSLNAAYETVKSKESNKEEDRPVETSNTAERAAKPTKNDNVVDIKPRPAARKIETDMQTETRSEPTNGGAIMLEMRRLSRDLSGARLATLIVEWVMKRIDVVAALADRPDFLERLSGGAAAAWSSMVTWLKGERRDSERGGLAKEAIRSIVSVNERKKLIEEIAKDAGLASLAAYEDAVKWFYYAASEKDQSDFRNEIVEPWWRGEQERRDRA